MPCFHPKYAVQSSPGAVLDFSGTRSGKSLAVPCGQCIGCRIDYAQQWASRCVMEMMYHSDNFFVTLTYDDEHVPFSFSPDPSSGEAIATQSCRMRDCQLFLKRLRRSGSEFRYFGCMDYGSSTFRPHYHFIFFGLALPDLSPYLGPGGSPSYKYYVSPYLQSVWSAGNVIVGEANRSTALYTARYICSKRKGLESQLYKDFNIEPPRSLMSLKPAIGHQWFVDHPDCLDFKYINLSGPDGGIKVTPPRYFHYLEKLSDPDTAQARSDQRYIKAMRSAKTKDDLSGNFFHQLEISERKALSEYRSLNRFL